MLPLIEKVINAYGGAEAWNTHTRLVAEVSVKGLAFTLKRRKPFERALLEMELHRPYSRILPIGREPDVWGVMDGNEVRLESLDGQCLQKRINPHTYFPYGRRLLYWDDLDMAWFANYAFWNYFTLPLLLQRPDIDWRQTEDNKLEALFPEGFPTHSRHQQFWFDPHSGLLQQHNYTATVISSLATAAHVVKAHALNGNIPYACKRVVTPMKRNGKAMQGPVLIDIDVHSCQLLP